MALRLTYVFATLALIGGIGAGGLGVARMLRGESPRGPVIASARIGEVRLRFDPAYARQADEAGGGNLDRLDIAARFPGFAPAGGNVAPKSSDPLIFMRLEQADTSLPPEEWTAKLYVRFLEPDQWTSPGGLVMRRFEPGSPYEREELYFAPPEGRLFAARCTRPRQPPDGLPETCLHDIRMNGLDVHVRFAPELLGEWERIDRGARALVERMTR